MSEQRISGYCQHNWLDLSKPCPTCADQQLEQKALAMEASLSAANAEVERLKAVIKHLEILEAGDGEQFKELFSKARKYPAYWTEAVDILSGELDISNKQRDALLANSKALADTLDKCFGADNVKIPAIESHNKLMEQFRGLATPAAED